jgi:hypothetical protein
MGTHNVGQVAAGGQQQGQDRLAADRYGQRSLVPDFL